MFRLYVNFLIFSSVVALSPVFAPLSAAKAQGASPHDAPEAEARDAFESGAAAYEEGRFRDALAAYERAYALSRRPKLLFNIGRAADGDGQVPRAIDAYKGYLLAFPDAANRKFVESRIDVLSHSQNDIKRQVTLPAAQQLVLRRQELHRTQLQSRGKGGPITMIIAGAVLVVPAALPLLFIGLEGGCVDEDEYGDCVTGAFPELYLPGVVLLVSGLTLVTTGAVLLHRRKAARRAIEQELRESDSTLRSMGVEATLMPWIAPRGATRGASAGLALSLRF